MAGKSVLVVDDSRLTRTMISEIIRHHHPDWTVVEAADAAQAMEQSEGREFDFMTIDMNMPGKDGLTLGAELRQRYPRAKLSLVTANVQNPVRRRASEHRFGFVSKPISEDKILAFLNSG